jgi:prolyl 4-hydroxylase
LKQWEETNTLAQKDVMGYISNPLNAFQMIKRLTVDLKLIKKQFPEPSKKLLDSAIGKSSVPSEADLAEAVESLLKLQSTYKLKTADLANGVIDGQKTIRELTTHDLFIIASEAFKIMDQDYFTQEYFNLVWDKINLGLYDDKEVDERFLMLRLVTSYNRTGQYQKAFNTVDTLIKKYPEYKQLHEVKSFFELNLKTFGSSKIFVKDPFADSFVKDGKYSFEKENILYGQACRGALKRSPKVDARLKCGFVHVYKNPFSRIAQFKIEEVNMNPYVVIFHDILADSEMEYLKTVSKPKVRWAVKTSGEAVKVTKSTWLSREGNHEIVKRISQRIEVS